jgi:hypothetical protein
MMADSTADGMTSTGKRKAVSIKGTNKNISYDGAYLEK